ncbi:MAG: hypothetical protein ABI811_08555 [Acidobacteriota bacterium]
MSLGRILTAIYTVALFGALNANGAANPRWVAVNSVTNRIYVANSGSNDVMVIDGATNATTSVSVGIGPVAAAVNPVTNKIYAINHLGAYSMVIDGANNATTPITALSLPSSVAVNSVTNKIYVANSGSDNVTVIDGATRATFTVSAGNNPNSIAVNTVTNKIYVANSESDNVTVIDGVTNSSTTISAGAQPYWVAVNSATNKIYVANLYDSTVTVIDGFNNSTTTVPVGLYPRWIAVNQVTNRIYVANYGSGNVTMIDGITGSTTNVFAGEQPTSVAVNAATNRIYVANYGSNNVTVIDGNTNATTLVSAGSSPIAVDVNPVTNRIYVANLLSDDITVINGATNASVRVDAALPAPSSNLTGTWALTADSSAANLKFAATVYIGQNGNNLSGQFAFSGPVTTFAPFSGTLFNTGVNMTVRYANGTSANFVGTLAANGSSAVGTSSNESGEVGEWSASRVAGAPDIAGVSNAASNVAGPIAPGEIISIYSTLNSPIGPATAVGLQLDAAGKVATTLGGARVLFLPSGVYAPLTYVSAGQINAVVPYETGGLANSQMQVIYLGQPSKVFAFQGTAVAPGIFTANGSGTGPGAILNHDGKTANSASNPEPKGGVVVLFLTGEGQTGPAGISGKVTVVAPVAPLTPKPLLPIIVKISGQAVPVLFYGEAPGLVSGVLQVNIQIPSTSLPGKLPLEVSVGGINAQSGVTVSVQ